MILTTRAKARRWPREARLLQGQRLGLGLGLGRQLQLVLVLVLVPVLVLPPARSQAGNQAGGTHCGVTGATKARTPPRAAPRDPEQPDPTLGRGVVGSTCTSAPVPRIRFPWIGVALLARPLALARKKPAPPAAPPPPRAPPAPTASPRPPPGCCRAQAATSRSQPQTQRRPPILNHAARASPVPLPPLPRLFCDFRSFSALPTPGVPPSPGVPPTPPNVFAALPIPLLL